ncbi:MAG: tetratricopeptide repeat protein, partial [Verrucomicrobia bacterium]|nr:tetratricopeptide repeat protein [Verrucomicrobiota bacterium]
ITPLPPTAEAISANQSFWQRAESPLQNVVRRLAADKPAGFKIESRFSKALNLRREPNAPALWTGAMYARTLNSWGVTLQQNDQFKPAAWCFQRAGELNPENVAAQINLGYNEKLQRADKSAFGLTKTMDDQLAAYRNWQDFLNKNGPLDEPQYCYQQGVTFAQGGLYREAAAQFLRAKQLAPDNFSTYLWLAQIYNAWQLSDAALELTATARKLPGEFPNQPASQVELANAEATANFNKNEPEAARRVLETTMARLPDDASLLNIALRLYLTYQRHTNALAVVEKQLRLTPDDPTALNNQSFIYLQLRQFDRAIQLLDRIIAAQPANAVALLNRAIAHFQSDHLDEARQDYAALQTLAPTAYQASYGLGEIAYRQKDFPTAIANYEHYLAQAPPGTAEAAHVTARLAELKTKSP